MPVDPHSAHEANRLGHELSETGTGRAANFIGWFAVGVAVAIVVAAVVAFWLLGGLRVPQPPFDAAPDSDSPNGAIKPSLQRAPISDLNAYQQQKEQALHRYGWIDRSGDVVHIPIERAMQLSVERGQGGGQNSEPPARRR